jgi:hypothetical protein
VITTAIDRDIYLALRASNFDGRLLPGHFGELNEPVLKLIFWEIVLRHSF